MTAAVDPNQPGAVRLRERARRFEADLAPGEDPRREPIWLLEQDRYLRRAVERAAQLAPRKR